MNIGNASRYRLTRRLGAGGMAQVVEGVSLGAAGFERRVAIKWILPELAGDESVRKMFLDEARIASRLHHANIVQVVDYGLMGGAEFIVFEFVDGLDMSRARKLAGEGSIPATVALHVVGEIAHALDYAHRLKDKSGAQMSVVHRDVTPSNVLVSWDGDVKLSDFGIALFETREERTAAGLVKGKASFLAPEQLMGAKATPAVDIYALGVTLHTLLTGSPGRYLGERKEPTSAVTLDDDVAAIVEHCTHSDPAQRPSAEDLARELGLLRVARTVESGRGELRQWLQGLERKGSSVSPMDPFAGRMMIGDSSGVFELTQPSVEVGAPPSLTEAQELSERSREPDSGDTGESEAPRPSRRRLLGLAFVAAVGVGGAWGLLARAGTPDTEAESDPALSAGELSASDPPTPVPIALAPPPSTEPPSTEPPSTEPPSTEPPSPEPASAQQASENGERASDARDRRPAVATAMRAIEDTRPNARPDPPPQAPTEAAPPTAEASAMASVRVGGAQLLRGRVFLDGQAVGQAPGLFQATVGTHLLRVESLDGSEVLLEREVNLQAHHTQTAPLRVIAR